MFPGGRIHALEEPGMWHGYITAIWLQKQPANKPFFSTLFFLLLTLSFTKSVFAQKSIKYLASQSQRPRMLHQHAVPCGLWSTGLEKLLPMTAEGTKVAIQATDPTDHCFLQGRGKCIVRFQQLEQVTNPLCCFQLWCWWNIQAPFLNPKSHPYWIIWNKNVTCLFCTLQ